MRYKLSAVKAQTKKELFPLEMPNCCVKVCPLLTHSLRVRKFVCLRTKTNIRVFIFSLFSFQFLSFLHACKANYRRGDEYFHDFDAEKQEDIDATVSDLKTKSKRIERKMQDRHTLVPKVLFWIKYKDI